MDPIPYKNKTIELKIVHDYTGIPLDQLVAVDIFTFWQWLRDAVIFEYSRSDEGRDYLRECYAAEQTEPDRETLRAQFMKEGHTDGK